MNVEVLEKSEEQDAAEALELSQEWGISQKEALCYILAERQAPKGVRSRDGQPVLAAPMGILNSPRAEVEIGSPEELDLATILKRHDVIPKETKFREQTDPTLVLNAIETFIETQPQILEQLGIKDWQNLSVPEAVLLAGAIVNHYIDYDTERQEQHRQHIDVVTYGAQDFLQEGKAVCLYFALTYEQVFEALKQRQIAEGNQRLNGTTSVSIRDFGVSPDAANHAYNLVFSRAADGSMDIVTVDPTWSDHLPTGSREWQEGIDYAQTRTGVALLQAMDLKFVDGRTVGPAIHDWVAEDPANIDRLMIAIKLNLNSQNMIYKGMKDRTIFDSMGQSGKTLRLLDEFLPQIQNPEDRFSLIMMAIELAIEDGNASEINYIRQAQQVLSEVNIEQLMADTSRNVSIMDKIQKIEQKPLYLLPQARVLGFYQTFLKGFMEVRRGQGRTKSVERLAEIDSRITARAIENIGHIKNALEDLVAKKDTPTLDAIGHYADEEGHLMIEDIREALGCLVRVAKENGGDEKLFDDLQTEILENIAKIEANPHEYEDIIASAQSETAII